MNKQDINYLEQLNNLEKQFNDYKKSNDEVMESYYEFFQTLFLNYELIPKEIIKNRRLLYNEMLLFIDNVCEKYNLDYWLNYGTLLGAYRHDGFIPWDDDIDISLMRKDFNIFLKIVPDEINKKNLDDCLRISNGYKVNENVIVTFPSIQCKIPKEENDIPLSHIAFIDLFPYDYAKSLDYCNAMKFNEIRSNFNTNALNQHTTFKNFNRDELIKEVYSKLGLTLNKTDYIIPGVDGVHAYGGLFNFMSFNTESIFPLKKIKFEGNLLKCPNNTKLILKQLYGQNYMDIPKIMRNHNAIKLMKEYPNINEALLIQTSKIKKVNETFNK